MLIIPATQEAEIGGSHSETGPEKVNLRPYLKNKLKQKDWVHGSSDRVRQFNPSSAKNRRRKEKESLRTGSPRVYFLRPLLDSICTERTK
jgi:hypothetical protein